MMHTSMLQLQLKHGMQQSHVYFRHIIVHTAWETCSLNPENLNAQITRYPHLAVCDGELATLWAAAGALPAMCKPLAVVSTSAAV